ncbi:methylmalonyl Co-A mutase-associated GTPase MeaB [Flexithrix dorotheae]|uniref:methylmalonyl Co-A mutase-associated GTPase MeaB n=1 Tax=Flexithrix dorotheae TaxID=70993 RepID=UPI00037203B8|nr:methylmalonyl Co-A mutase-associated GTPase MeaB [Flexithrix dorotheae]
MARRRLTIDEYINGIISGDRFILSRAITLIESALESDYALSQELLEKLMPHTGQSIRVGVSGVPGVGKSTLIETFGDHIISNDHKVAVLAIDPSSQKTRGSIMGDKTRMENLSQNPNAYIRPSATGSSLGGVARKTRETMLLCEAAGFDVILIETVGVGQSETTVRGMVDFFLLLMLSGAGDELQGIKKGIMEMADALVITKADGDNIAKAKAAKSEYKNALHLFRPEESGWFCNVLSCSALTKDGIPEIWEEIEKYRAKTKNNGWFFECRKRQNLKWMHDSIQEELIRKFYNNPMVREALQTFEDKVASGKIPPYSAGEKLIEIYTK